MKGKQVLQVRQKLGMTQAQFWNQFGTTQSGGSRYEAGRRIPAPVLEQLLCVVSKRHRDAHFKRLEGLAIDFTSTFERKAKRRT